MSVNIKKYNELLDSITDVPGKITLDSVIYLGKKDAYDRFRDFVWVHRDALSKSKGGQDGIPIADMIGKIEFTILCNPVKNSVREINPSQDYGEKKEAFDRIHQFVHTYFKDINKTTWAKGAIDIANSIGEAQLQHTLKATTLPALPAPPVVSLPQPAAPLQNPVPPPAPAPKVASERSPIDKIAGCAPIGIQRPPNNCWVNTTLQVLISNNQFMEWILTQDKGPLEQLRKVFIAYAESAGNKGSYLTNNASAMARDAIEHLMEKKGQPGWHPESQQDASEAINKLLDICADALEPRGSNQGKFPSERVTKELETPTLERLIQILKISELKKLIGLLKPSDERTNLQNFIWPLSVDIGLGEMIQTRICPPDLEKSIKTLELQEGLELMRPTSHPDGKSVVIDRFAGFLPLPVVGNSLQALVSSYTMERDSDGHPMRVKLLIGNQEIMADYKFLTERFEYSSPPSHLTLQLKRFGFHGTSSKICSDIDVPEELDFTTVSKIGKYELRAVTIHSGFTPQSGHYYAYVKRGKQWYCCDDSRVSEIRDIWGALKVSGGTTPYVLHYNLISERDPEEEKKED